MILVLLTLSLQVCFITDLVLNRMISIFANNDRDPILKLADGSFFAIICSTLATIAAIPLKVVIILLNLGVHQLFLLFSGFSLFPVIAVLNEGSGGLIVLLVNVYNIYLGEWVHVTLTAVFGLLSPIGHLFLPFWNTFLYIIIVFWTNTFLPFVYVNVDVNPALLLDLSMMVSTDVVQNQRSNFMTYQNCGITTQRTSRPFPKVQKTIMVGGAVDGSLQHYVLMRVPCISRRRSTEKVFLSTIFRGPCDVWTTLESATFVTDEENTSKRGTAERLKMVRRTCI
jgi:hypothetical protein